VLATGTADEPVTVPYQRSLHLSRAQATEPGKGARARTIDEI